MKKSHSGEKGNMECEWGRGNGRVDTHVVSCGQSCISHATAHCGFFRQLPQGYIDCPTRAEQLFDCVSLTRQPHKEGFVFIRWKEKEGAVKRGRGLAVE